MNNATLKIAPLRHRKRVTMTNRWHWRCSTIMLSVVFILLSGSGCSTNTGKSSAPESLLESVIFTDVARQTELNFVHENGMSGKFYMVEMVGPGAALFDMDNDGDLDVFITQGHLLGEP
ncbi:MAG: hypothetical protein ABGZ35_12395, partial [Planctomycetaceae bacterium]